MYAKEAVRHLDRMTERERYRARGLAYMATGDYSQCLKEFGDMIGRYSADTVALNNLAYCYSQIRDMHKAADSMRRVSEILPKRALYRLNLALYSAYGSQFEDALDAAHVTEQLGHPLSGLPLAFASLGQGKVREATAAYEALGKTNAQGASFAASGLADIAIYEGRYSDAVQMLDRAAAVDSTAKFADRAAAKYTALGYAEISRRRPAAASAAAEKALAISESIRVRFLAARIFVDAGEVEKARAIAAALGRELQAEPQAYAKIVDGQIALTRAVRQTGDPRDAIKPFTEANALLDTWIGRFYLGRAYLAAGLVLQADSEFDRCVGRRGELFLDEDPRFGQLPLVYYYQGQAREGLNSAGYAELYRTYLGIRDKTGEDPLLADARARFRIATSPTR
jgi:Tfp pilus assembly protein PilF